MKSFQERLEAKVTEQTQEMECQALERYEGLVAYASNLNWLKMQP